MNSIFSQRATAQDSWVVETLRSCRGGFFVEIGGYDGIKHSNTLYLEKALDWRGLLVEADPDLFVKMARNRPGCQHDNRAAYCVTDHSARFSRGDQWGGVYNFLPQAWKDEAIDRKTPECWVNTATLNTLLSQHNCPMIIDYLSLDIEGAELSVLTEFFRIPKYRFRCMTVEYQQDAGILMRLERLMEPHGYTLDKVQAWDAFFITREIL